MKLFFQTLTVLEKDSNICKMREYEQHRTTNSFEHCRDVALESYSLSRKLNWNVDEKCLARGAMLHDFYLYDIKQSTKSAWDHGVHHPKKALHNAEEFYPLTVTERDIISSHMWPLTFWHVPRSKEAWIVCAADKLCAMREILGVNGKKRTKWINIYLRTQQKNSLNKL